MWMRLRQALLMLKLEGPQGGRGRRRRRGGPHDGRRSRSSGGICRLCRGFLGCSGPHRGGRPHIGRRGRGTELLHGRRDRRPRRSRGVSPVVLLGRGCPAASTAGAQHFGGAARMRPLVLHGRPRRRCPRRHGDDDVALVLLQHGTRGSQGGDQ